MSRKVKNAIAVLFIILGLVGMLYPLASTLLNNKYNADLAEKTEQKLEKIPEDEKVGLWDAMLAYNKDLKRDPIDVRRIGSGREDPRYSEYLDVGKPQTMDEISQIVIPDIDVSLPVYRGTEDKTLARGAGHLFGTTLPTGGEGSNTAISAHTGMVNASMFDALPKLKPGQDIYLSTLGHKLRYKMVDSQVVPPDSTDALPAPGGDGDYLYLITCTPYGLNTDRLIVRAERAELQDPPPDLSEISNSLSGWTWWMTVSVICAVVVVVLAVTPFFRKKRKVQSGTSRFERYSGVSRD